MIGETMYFFTLIVVETFILWATLVEIDRTKHEIEEKIDTLSSNIWIWTREENQ